MCRTTHYLCACTHYTTTDSGSRFHPCWLRRFCTRHTTSYKPHDRRWKTRCCERCERASTPEAIEKMRSEVRDAAGRLRAEFGGALSLPLSSSSSSASSSASAGHSVGAGSTSRAKHDVRGKGFATSGPYRAGYGAGSFSGAVGRTGRGPVSVSASVPVSGPGKVSHTSPGQDSGYGSSATEGRGKRGSRARAKNAEKQTVSKLNWRDALYGEQGYLARRGELVWDGYGYGCVR